jgi:hypothetical protein
MATPGVNPAERSVALIEQAMHRLVVSLGERDDRDVSAAARAWESGGHEVRVDVHHRRHRGCVNPRAPSTNNCDEAVARIKWHGNGKVFGALLDLNLACAERRKCDLREPSA